jgi:hypothetical protein
MGLLSACSWFHAKAPPPAPPELIVTGAPAESAVFVDDVRQSEPSAVNDKSMVLSVTEGAHKVEIRIGDRVVYREDLYVGRGDKRVVTVLSGSNRE